MTAPKLEDWKFWIVKPYGGYNYIPNPTFNGGVTGWTASGAGVTIASTGDEARRGAYSMKVNTATGVISSTYYGTCSVADTLNYTFSCDVKGTSGQAMSISIRSSAGGIKGTTSFTATGYWQRKEVTILAAETAADYRAVVTRNAVASTDAFYVDGAQFEQTVAATTLIEGYLPGCGWVGTPYASTSWRDPRSGMGGVLIDISSYAKIISVQGLGNGQWNQIMTKMTSGGDMYQTHIRKSRNFSMVLAYNGDNQGDLQANRKVIIDALRPDYLFGEADERRIIRYQGFDANGNEATQPVDIVCVPQPSLTDTPSMPVFQKDILNFTIPSGLLQGAYNEGKELDLYANFAAEFIVKRDKDGNWCEWDTDHYDSLITGLNGAVYCMAEGPDGKIYVGGNFTDAGGVTTADKLARWNPISEAWEAVVAGINGIVYCMAFDANGDLFIGGAFSNLGSTNGDYIVKITDVYGTPTINALGTGTNGTVYSIAIAPDGSVYAGGMFSSAGDVANTNKIAKWDGTSWVALSTGLNNTVDTLAFAPNGDLYIGGLFTDSAYPKICKWNGTAFSVVGTAGDISGGIPFEIDTRVYSLAFSKTGELYVGGNFYNAGDIANADNIVKWNGSRWEPLGVGANSWVNDIIVDSSKIYVAGSFTSIGGLTLNTLAAVWSNGAWQPLDIDLPGAGAVFSILPASDGSLYIGGLFSTAGETPDVNAETGVVALNLEVASASANTYPFMQIHGPGTLKAIKNYSTGKSIAFDGLTIQAGEYINLFFDPLNLQFKGSWAGRPNLMRYVVAGSDYGDFYLRPGANYISLFMTGTTSASGATIQWTPLFWGLDGALL